MHILKVSKKMMCKYINQIDQYKKIKEDYTHPLMFIALFFGFGLGKFYLWRYIPQNKKYYTYPEFNRVIHFVKKAQKIALINFIILMILVITVIKLIPQGYKIH